MDLVSTISEQLRSHTPFDSREEDSLIQISNLISDIGSDAFDREKSQHHITGSAYIIWQDKMLLLFHRKLQFWLQPGGHLEIGESPLQAAYRETIEETNIKAQLDDEIFFVDVHKAYDHFHYDIRFKGYAIDPFIKPGATESKSVAWLNFDLLSSLGDASNAGAYKKILRNSQ